MYQGQDYMCIQMIIAFVMLWYLILDVCPQQGNYIFRRVGLSVCYLKVMNRMQ